VPGRVRPVSSVRPVIVVGAGIAGVACARRLHDAGQPVRVLERADHLGGRMASRIEQVAGHPHPVDLGAPYFTAADSRFAAVVAGWQTAGLARPWTDTVALAGADGRGLTGSTTGPTRWTGNHGMRRLVEALAEGLDVRLATEVTRVDHDDTGLPLVDGEPAAAVVLAMPDPQAETVLAPEHAEDLGLHARAWSPVVTLWASWPQRWWPEFDGIFVADSPVLTWVADSGRSRGDGTAVLVTHSTARFARLLLTDGSATMLSELGRVLGADPVPTPDWFRTHRWRLASAERTHPEPFILTPRSIGVCGDAWGPRSRVEQAWGSGNGLAEVLLKRLAVP
jgi:renalase